MTDGERREPFQPLTSDEVQVPIASGTATSQGPQPGEEKDEDALSACKSIQDSLASAGSSTRDPAHEGENQVPYPALASTVFFCLHQTTRPRSWCLKLFHQIIPVQKFHRSIDNFISDIFINFSRDNAEFQTVIFISRIHKLQIFFQFHT
ncbi:voltage-dependent T-type calcium channel subunit alpha-1H-like isoform X1 [Rhineura floridana]|uniref:voltage-dependent T-type calcium channel subunit alpha-1H-like isoform X1 n=1 Tax=Rhineura floridana TaxID=261503 RepID=UPI002AC8161A|nr:voltage-dependent T-type calcium channel subunit alpha-1H-like isoform X1 [Rhineura floridana]XP_061455719.1 voltage-dependent T-type calcium channel subunit alpha-1H-like isoform X1 [Rhineura floridana]